MFESECLRVRMTYVRFVNQVDTGLYTEQWTDLIFHFSFWASLCSWNLIIQKCWSFKIQIHISFGFNRLSYSKLSCLPKNAQSLLNLNKWKSESWIPSCFENLIFSVFFQDFCCFLSRLYWIGTIGILRPKGNACIHWWSLK